MREGNKNQENGGIKENGEMSDGDYNVTFASMSSYNLVIETFQESISGVR